ncbi:hypothetical protein MMC25_000319 [Agyrium rufum]|nr:hypothetical protein [Agyrium rufum]
MATTTASVVDPFAQSLTLVSPDGIPFNISISDIDEFITYSLQISINYAAQLGASLVLLIVLILITKPEKRSSPIFILNCVSLSLNFIRNLLQCLYFTGPFSEFYAYFAGEFSRVPTSAFATSITATVFTFLLLVCVQASLLLQCQVVCVTLRKLHRQFVLGASLLMALFAAGFRFALAIENAKSIISLSNMISLTWLSSATNITTSISIFWFCAVFLTKLGFALHQRWKLGLRHFGPMQIIFIMGFQTLTIPALFSILEYTTDLPSMDSNVLTLVTIFLPLSSLWAASHSDKPTKSSLKHIGAHTLTKNTRTNSDATLLMKRTNTTRGSDSPESCATMQVLHSSLASPTKDYFKSGIKDVEAQV